MSGKKQERPWEDRWALHGTVGKGGQGTALKATSKDGTRVGVAKLLNRDSEKTRQRMYSEVVSLEILGNAGLKVPKVIEHNTPNYRDRNIALYFVMDLIPGKNLNDEIAARGPQSLDKSVALCLDLCETIKEAHRNKVLHRDLKPDNIIARDFDKNDLVIVDYGLSYNYQDMDTTETSEQMRNRFLALPEMNTPNADFYDPRSDMTVVSGLLYFFLTGHRPGHLIDGNDRLPHRRGEWSVRRHLGTDARCEHVEFMLDRGLARNLNDRFQSWDELIGRLKDVLHPDSLDEEDTLTLAARLKRQLDISNPTTRLANLKAETKVVKEAIMK